MQQTDCPVIKRMTQEEVDQFYAFGFAQYGAGHLSDAVDTFRVLCTHRPFEVRFWFGLGAALQEAKKYEEALHQWGMTILLKKEDPYPYFHAAECYFSLQNVAEGGKALKVAEELIAEDHPLKSKISLLRQQWRLS